MKFLSNLFFVDTDFCKPNVIQGYHTFIEIQPRVTLKSRPEQFFVKSDLITPSNIRCHDDLYFLLLHVSS